MIYQDKPQFFAALNSNLERLMCLDIGSKKIGVALAHRHTGVASPLCVVMRQNRRQDLNALSKIINDWQVGGIVVGLPQDMDGQHGKAAKVVEEFLPTIIKLELPVITHDERLSTAAAHSLMRSHAVSRQKRHESDDMIAASLILENFLAHV